MINNSWFGRQRMEAISTSSKLCECKGTSKTYSQDTSWCQISNGEWHWNLLSRVGKKYDNAISIPL